MILPLLIATKQYIKQYHWLSKDYQTHLLAEKLAEELEDYIDELAELSVVVDERTDPFVAHNLLNQATEILQSSYTGSENAEMLRNISILLGDLLEKCRAYDLQTEGLSRMAFSDYLGRLSNLILRKLYLINVQYDGRVEQDKSRLNSLG